MRHDRDDRTCCFVYQQDEKFFKNACVKHKQKFSNKKKSWRKRKIYFIQLFNKFS